MRFIKMSRNIYTIKEDWYNIFVATENQQAQIIYVTEIK